MRREGERKEGFVNAEGERERGKGREGRRERPKNAAIVRPVWQVRHIFAALALK